MNDELVYNKKEEEVLDQLTYIELNCEYSDDCTDELQTMLVDDGLVQEEEGIVMLSPMGEQVLGLNFSLTEETTNLDADNLLMEDTEEYEDSNDNSYTVITPVDSSHRDSSSDIYDNNKEDLFEIMMKSIKNK